MLYEVITLLDDNGVSVPLTASRTPTRETCPAKIPSGNQGGIFRDVPGLSNFWLSVRLRKKPWVGLYTAIIPNRKLLSSINKECVIEPTTAIQLPGSNPA